MAMKREGAEPDRPPSGPRGGGHFRADTGSPAFHQHNSYYTQDPRNAPQQRPAFPDPSHPTATYPPHTHQPTPQQQAYAPPPPPPPQPPPPQQPPPPPSHPHPHYSPNHPSNSRALPAPPPLPQPGPATPSGPAPPSTGFPPRDPKASPNAPGTYPPVDAKQNRNGIQLQHSSDYPRPPSGGEPHHTPHMGHVEHGHPPVNTMYPPHQANGNGHYPHPIETHHGYGPAPAGYHPAPSPVSAHAPYMTAYSQPPYAKKRTVRAQQACNQCRQRKQKCDEQRPCQFCSDGGFTCEYKDIPPPKTDRIMQIILDRLAAIEDSGREAAAKMHNIERSLKITPTVGSSPASSVTAHNPTRDDSRRYDELMHDNTLQEEFVDRRKPNFDDDRVSIEGHKVNLNDHKTAAHQFLFDWPTIGGYFYGIVSRSDNYPMRLEEARGSLRLYGRGEGLTHHDLAQQGDSPPTSEGGNTNGSGESPGSNSGDIRYQLRWLDFDEAKIRRLHESYLVHMHALHPFLDKGRLQKQIDEFIVKMNTTGDKTSSPLPLPSRIDQHHRSNKRRRLDDQDGDPTSFPINTGISHGSGRHENDSKPRPKSTITNAIVLLVLALGEVLLEDGRFPGAVNNYLTRRDLTNQVRSPVSNGVPSPAEDRSSPYPGSPLGRSDAELKNMDIIPGLPYFAYASDILGNMHSGNEVYHAQAFLLASLYINQLGRGLESYSWINSAARVIRVNVKQHKRYLRFPEHERDHVPRCPDSLTVPGQEREAQKYMAKMELLKFTFWSALQLESDILAELSLPPSYITEFEGSVQYPSGVYDDLLTSHTGQDEEVHTLYSAQITLRQQLNRVHSSIYQAKDRDPHRIMPGLYEPTGAREIRALLSEIFSWRTNLRVGPVPLFRALAWDDHEPPVHNLNVARMRGKYYGAETVTTRPYLQYVLYAPEPDHLMLKRAWEYVQSFNPELSPADVIDALENNKELPNDSEHSREGINTNAIVSMVMTRTCLRACIQSTTAFDNIPTRLKVTNIFGTVHAQFGNCLVLAACSESWLKQLDGLVPVDRVQDLIMSTIKKCRSSEHLSPALKIDRSILEKALTKLRDISQATSSFMSANSSFSGV